MQAYLHKCFGFITVWGFTAGASPGLSHTATNWLPSSQEIHVSTSRRSLNTGQNFQRIYPEIFLLSCCCHFLFNFLFLAVLLYMRSPCTVQVDLPQSCRIDILSSTTYSSWLLIQSIDLCEWFLVSLAPGFSSVPLSALLLINSISTPVISKSRLETDGPSQKTLSISN